MSAAATSKMVTVDQAVIRKVVVEAFTVCRILERLNDGTEMKFTEDLRGRAHELAIASGLAPENYFDHNGNDLHPRWQEFEDESDEAASSFYAEV